MSTLTEAERQALDDLRARCDSLLDWMVIRQAEAWYNQPEAEAMGKRKRTRVRKQGPQAKDPRTEPRRMPPPIRAVIARRASRARRPGH